MDRPEIDAVVLPARPDSVRRARAVVVRVATDAGLPTEVVDAASIAASELVTNAIVHGRGPIALRTSRDATSLRVEVEDTAPALPELRDEDRDGDSGRGLAIVAALSRDWGCDLVPGADGKSVWFTVERPSPPTKPE
jgi:anti-sigma regulatory factor (Ser/Thr protein kinase)